MRSQRGIGALCMLMGLAVCLADQPPLPTPITMAFLDNHTGATGLLEGGRLSALVGVPFATNPCPAGPGCVPTDTFVTDFIAVDRDAFGVDFTNEDTDLQLVRSGTTFNNKFKIYTYRQTMEDLEVHGSVVKIPVLLGATEERIGYVGLHLFQPPQNPLPNQNESTATAAIAVVSGSGQYGHLTDFSDALDAEKVIFEDDAGSLHRTWRFYGWDSDEGYLFFVDTTSQAIVDALNQVHNFDVEVSGTVRGWVTPGIAASTPWNPPVPVGLPGIEVREGCPSPGDMWNTNSLTFASGAYPFGDPLIVAQLGDVASHLGGPLGLVRDDSRITCTPEDIVECATVPDTCDPCEGVDMTFAQPLCEGGASEGNVCNPHTDCPDGRCLDGACNGGDADGDPCKDDTNCPNGGVCITQCMGGVNDRQSCDPHVDCGLGLCVWSEAGVGAVNVVLAESKTVTVHGPAGSSDGFG